MGLKKCTYCNEEIPENMVRCPYCCSILGSGSAHSPVPSDVGDRHREEPGRQMSKIKVNQPVREQEAESREQTFGRLPAKETQVKQRPVKEMPGARRCLTNGQKVFLTVVTVMFPIIGQIIGILFSIIVLAYVKEPDQQSFASALLAAGIIVFMLSCFFLMMISLIIVVLFLMKII